MTQQTFVTCVSGVVGSIVDTELGAHAIVNASNPAVALGSGVSGAIRDACGGTAYQSEVHQVWEDEFDEPLEPGDRLVTERARQVGSAGSCTFTASPTQRPGNHRDRHGYELASSPFWSRPDGSRERTTSSASSSWARPSSGLGTVESEWLRASTR